jgi:hypothetical protein
MQCQAEALNNLYELIQEKLANDDISGKITSPKDVQNHDHEQIADYVAYKVING